MDNEYVYSLTFGMDKFMVGIYVGIAASKNLFNISNRICATKKVNESNMRGEMNEYMLYLPLYDEVTELKIGVDEKAEIKQPQIESPVIDRPVICYGTSITQGGCATRPGMVYTNILSRMLNREVVNLGFSGYGHLEYEIVALMTLRNPSVIVMDFIPNVSAAMLRERFD